MDHEIIVVDDDSPDFTWKIVEQLGLKHPWLKLHRRMGERGLSSAVLKGVELASGDIFGVMDADGSHDESILPRLIEAVQQGAELALGSRRIPGGGAEKWPWYRSITSLIATAGAKMILNVGLSDPMSGYFIFSRSFYNRCKDRLSPEGYKILLEVYVQGRPKNVVEIPYVFKDRVQGYSKLTGKVMWQYVRMLWRLQRQSKSRLQ